MFKNLLKDLTAVLAGDSASGEWQAKSKVA
jgi:hypothetical protein